MSKACREGYSPDSLSARRAEKAESLNTRVMALQPEVTNAEEKLKRLYRLVEDGLTDLDEVQPKRHRRVFADEYPVARPTGLEPVLPP